MQQSDQEILEQDGSAAQAEDGLREQRAELTRMMADLRKMQEAVRRQQKVDVQALLEENEQLRQRLADGGEPSGEAADAKSLAELEELRGENQALRKLLQETEAQLKELQKKPAASAEPMDVDSFEAELNQFRCELEADRQKLNTELEQLRTRNQELSDATREMEMEMSRERADLARERMRLERLRDELKTDLERMQREAGVRDSLAGVQRLREEIAAKNHGTPKPPAAAQPELDDRLRSLRNRLNEG